MLAHVSNVYNKLSLNLLIGIVRKTDCARLGQGLDSGGDIDTVTVDVALVDNDVTDINADAELYPPIFRYSGIVLGQNTLDLHSAAYRIDGAGKFNQSTVAGSLYNPAAIFRNFGIDDFASVGFERCEGAFLVNTH